MKKIKIAINGATSTGKTTFIRQLSQSLTDKHIKNVIVTDLAINCPLPIKKDHTIESTLWIAAKNISQETEAEFKNDVVIVDRSILDCWAYFKAACNNRYSDDDPKLLTLSAMISHWIPTYDFLYNSVINQDLPIENKKGRDMDYEYRNNIDKELKMATILFKITPRYLKHCDVKEELSFLLNHIVNAKNH